VWFIFVSFIDEIEHEVFLSLYLYGGAHKAGGVVRLPVLRFIPPSSLAYGSTE
jgi:hypothetical protein